MRACSEGASRRDIDTWRSDLGVDGQTRAREPGSGAGKTASSSIVRKARGGGVPFAWTTASARGPGSALLRVTISGAKASSANVESSEISFGGAGDVCDVVSVTGSRIAPAFSIDAALGE